MRDTIEVLKEKIGLFKNNLSDYKSKSYDEYSTRADFIDSLFAALGWDMYNKEGVIEQFREVIREDKIIIDGSKKAPDYSFRIGSEIIFYVEAKKPSVDIKNNREPSYQLRRYAYTRGLKLSILTDFEEIAIYDAQIKPLSTDSAGTARIFYCTYDELFKKSKLTGYETNFDFLLDTFSKQAIKNGSFNRYAISKKNKKGTESVDKGFLKLLNTWREELAKHIALKNENIDEYNLNIVVQKLIDRLIFLRIAEDRQVEPENNLYNISNLSDVYSELSTIFDKADDKYNSGLFISEDWMKNLFIEDKILKSIIQEMYYPKCPYEFSVLPLEILGKAYEQFLGKTITFTRKTKYGHKVEIEEKPEVRKAGGVYYTPPYIVDYIVENTVGEKIKNKKPNEIKKLTIVDPACGSGSFLIGAYDYLLKYHLEYYLENKTRKNKAIKAGEIYQTKTGKYKLSTKIKSDILVNNIYGVDIDGQAVEVTKLSLLLKVLEDENLEYSEQLFRAEYLHMLPNLGNNIKCGNSLIGSDFYDNQDLSLFGNDEMRKINTFDWEDEFSTIFADGGFDCVIGNPPWVYTKYVEWGEETKNYLSKNYLSFSSSVSKGKSRQSGKINLYTMFIVKSIMITKENGLFSFIVPNTILRTTTYDVIRKYILDNITIEKIVDLKDKIFDNVTASTIIFIFNKEKNENNKIDIIDNPKINNEHIVSSVNKVSQSNFLNNISYTFNIFVNDMELKVLNKINTNKDALKLFCKDNIAGIDAPKYLIVEQKNDNAFPLLEGKSIDRYITKKNTKYIIWDKENINRTRPDYLWELDKKIIIRRISGGLKPLYATIDTDKNRTFASINNLVLNESCNYDYNFILALINSNVLNFFYSHNFSNKSNLTVNISKTFLENLPIPKLDIGSEVDKTRHDKIVSLVNQILIAQKDLYNTTIESDKKFIKQKVDLLDRQINNEVYKLYDLDAKDIDIIESSITTSKKEEN